MNSVKITNDLIQMAWSDKISFEEIKKKQVFLKKKSSGLWEKLLKKAVIFYGENVLEEDLQNIEN